MAGTRQLRGMVNLHRKARALACSLALILCNCSPTTQPVSSVTTTFDGTGPEWYAQAEKEQPYAALWRQQNHLDLWVAWDERKTSPLFPYPSCRAKFNLALSGKRDLGGTWTGSTSASWAESCTVTSATYQLTESSPDTLTGWLSLAWTGPCGATSTVLPLTLARTPNRP